MDLTEINGLIYLWELEQYNNKSSAITFISESLSEQQFILEMIEREEEYKLNVGIPRLVKKGSKLMLTISSILFLHRYNLMEDLIEYYDLIILRSTVKYFEMELENIEKQIDFIEYEIYNNQRDLAFNKLEIRKYLEQYREEKDKIQETFEILKAARIIDLYDRYDSDKIDLSSKISIYSKLDMDRLFSKADLESAYFASNHDVHLLIDDQLTKTMFIDYLELDPGLISTTAGIVNSLLLEDLDRYVDILEELVGMKYEYIWDYAALFKILFNYKTLETENRIKNILVKALDMDSNGYYKRLIIKILSLDMLEDEVKDMLEDLVNS